MKYTIKYKNFAVCILAAGMLLICTCSGSMGDDTSTIKISLGTVTGKAAGGISVSELKHIITFSGPTGIKTLTITGGGSTSVSVAPGHWQISVEAYLGDELYAVGTASVDVKAGRNTNVMVQMTVVWAGAGSSGGTASATAPAITTASLPGGTVGTAYSEALAATGTAPITWAIDSGLLPDGLTLNAATGVVSGTPTVANTFTFAVKAANAAGNDTKSFSVVIIPIPTYTVSFDANGGTGTVASMTENAGTSITVPAGTSLSLTDYTFTGWNTVADGSGTSYNAGNSYVPAGNVTLFAQWIHLLSIWTAITDPVMESAFPNVANSAFVSINAIAYGNGRLVAGGSSGTMIYSDDDGDTWNLVSVSGFGTDTISRITFGNNTFVAVGQNGSVSYSSDGITWTGTSAMAFNSLYIQGIAFGNGRFVAGAFTNPNSRIVYSDNGSTWIRATETIFGTNYMLRSIGYGNGRFIAAGSGSTIAYSDDGGVTWTQSTTGHTSGQICGIAYNSGRFVAGATDGGSVRLFYSDDYGDNWNEAVGSIGDVYSIIHGNGYFVAAGQSGRIGYSSDGINWIAVPGVFTGGLYSDIYDIVYTGSRFIAVGKGMAYCDF